MALTKVQKYFPEVVNSWWYQVLHQDKGKISVLSNFLQLAKQ